MVSERRKKIVLAGISVLVTLLLAEAALRILGIGAMRRGSPWFAGGNHPRYLFQAEPIEVTALAAAAPDDPRFDEVAEMHGVVLRFPGERLATFTCSPSPPLDARWEPG